LGSDRINEIVAHPSLTTVQNDPNGSANPLRFRERARARSGSADLLLFSVGREHFAVELRSVEEVVESPELREVPGSSDALLGVFPLRDGMVPLFAPGHALGVDSPSPACALVMRFGNRRIGLAVDDVDDILTFDLAELRDAPAHVTGDDVLVGLAWRDRCLISVLDARALLGACIQSASTQAA
jgi:chemotaxis signal transduction protein